MKENREDKEQPSKRPKKNVKEQIRRSKNIKNRHRDFNIYYQNVRGLKSKIDSLAETIDDYEPTLICLVETHLSKEEQIQIPGYKIFRNDGTNNSRGILIVIKEKLKTIVVEVTREEEIGQSLWVLLNNQKAQVRMEVIYGPQENVTPNRESISDQVAIGKENSQQIIIPGNFNAKIGNQIKNNKETITKAGRHLKRLVGKQNKINGESNKCEGLWIREQGEEKSIIDYVITTKVEIQGTKQCRKIYSDHNAIMLNIDFISKMEAKGQKKNITRKGYQKYKKFIKERQISKIIKKGTLQESYNKWTEEVEDAIKQVQKTVRKNPRKDIRELQKIRKNLRIKIRNTADACEKRILKDRLKFLKGHIIIDNIKESRGNQIKQIAESISNNIDNGREIWEVKRKVKRKDEAPHFIINSEGRKIENGEEILKEYQKYYERLLETRPPEN